MALLVEQHQPCHILVNWLTGCLYDYMKFLSMVRIKDELIILTVFIVCGHWWVSYCIISVHTMAKICTAV